ncbi:MAG: hypothetical protein Q9187_005106 [Circinaria calcarea]
MSGAEAIAVSAVISSIISIVDGIKQAYDVATNTQGLPEAFREVASQLPIVENILGPTQQHINRGDVDVHSCEALKHVVEACEKKAKKLDDMFQKAMPTDGTSGLKRYYKAVKAYGNGIEVQNLMKGILEDVQLLASERGMKTATKDQQEQIVKAITEVSAVPPSAPEHEFQETGFTNTNTASGIHYNAQGEYVAQGDARVVSASSGSSHDSGYSSDYIVDIPEQLESVQTLRFMGFDEEAAGNIWTRWAELSKDPDFPDEFQTMADAYIGSIKVDAEDETDNWHAVLRQLGISKELIDVIMIPEYSDLRMTASAKYWLRDTFAMRFRSLLGMQQASTTRIRALMKERASRAQRQRKPGGTFSAGRDPIPNVQTGIATPNFTPGTTKLWRGGDQELINLARDQNTEANNLRTQDAYVRPTDFQGRAPLLYFTLDRTTGVRYAKWAALKSNGLGALLYMEVPNSVLQSMDPYTLQDDEWKQIVWHSRRSLAWPDSLQFLKSRLLLIGDIATGKNQAYHKIAKWQDITEHHKLKRQDGDIERTTTQYVFQDEEALALLNRHARLEVIGIDPDIQPQGMSKAEASQLPLI